MIICGGSMDIDLVLRQGSLKLLKFGDTARTFGDAYPQVKFPGLSFLDGTGLFEIFSLSLGYSRWHLLKPLL